MDGNPKTFSETGCWNDLLDWEASSTPDCAESNPWRVYVVAALFFRNLSVLRRVAWTYLQSLMFTRSWGHEPGRCAEGRHVWGLGQIDPKVFCVYGMPH